MQSGQAVAKMRLFFCPEWPEGARSGCRGRSCRDRAVVVGAGLRIFGYYWGVLGVTAVIASAVYRLTPRVLVLDPAMFGWPHWTLLLLFTPYMAYAEGYKGFHLNFAPRVVARALYLRDQGRFWHILFAPLFCMGFIHATPRRRLISVLVTGGIVLLVLLVSQAPQPWRGLIDAGVVTGLALGIASLLWYGSRAALWGTRPDIPLDLPVQQ